jgi:hypothetical protein
METNTPRLKNLLMLAKSLVSASDGLNNLTLEDKRHLVHLIEDDLPTPVSFELMSDWMIDVVARESYRQALAALPANEATLFCVACEDDTPHRRALVHHISYYKCTRCGVFNQVTLAEVMRD